MLATTNNKCLWTLTAVASLVLFSGCPSESTPTTPPRVTKSAGDGHDHADDKHADDHKHGKDTHDHGHGKAPHGGHLIELGDDEFHAELVDDEKAGTVTVYLLGSDAKTPAESDEDQLVLNLVVDSQPKQFTLKKTGDKRDQFGAKDTDLMKALDAAKTPGRLNVKIKGKSYVGKFEHSHADHDHKH